MPDALQLLRNDHDEVKDLFKQFENTDDTRQKGVIARNAIVSLMVHAAIEEEIFYPAVRQEGEDTAEMMNEAEQEHHVAELLMGELLEMAPDDDMFVAKFTVLAENVKHHIQEEESEMLPKAAEEGSQRMQALGAQMEERKLELMDQVRQEMRAGGGRRTASRGRAGARRRTSTRSTRPTRSSGSNGARRSSTPGKATSRPRSTAGRGRSRNGASPRVRSTTRATSGGTRSRAGTARSQAPSRATGSRRSSSRSATRGASASRASRGASRSGTSASRSRRSVSRR